MEITGKLIQKLPIQTGVSQRGEWQKLDFIIETIEQYPKKICATAWRDTVDLINKINIGDTIIMSFSIESREYNGKWYTNIQAYRIEIPASPSNTNAPTQRVAQNPAGAPQQPAQQTTAAPFEGFGSNTQEPEINDDLPF